MSSNLKRNNSVPEELDRLPEIKIRNGPSENRLYREEKKSLKLVKNSNLDDSFKRNPILLEAIKEDRDDDYCQYNDE
jgi:hypothetical protein